jgi:hypothetical protein
VNSALTIIGAVGCGWSNSQKIVIAIPIGVRSLQIAIDRVEENLKNLRINLFSALAGISGVIGSVPATSMHCPSGGVIQAVNIRNLNNLAKGEYHAFDSFELPLLVTQQGMAHKNRHSRTSNHDWVRFGKNHLTEFRGSRHMSTVLAAAQSFCEALRRLVWA